MVGALRFSGGSRADKLSATVCTSNPAIDAAINIGARKAQAANIDYKVQIIGDAAIGIEAADDVFYLDTVLYGSKKVRV